MFQHYVKNEIHELKFDYFVLGVLALKYFIDSVYSNKTFRLKGKTLLYAGLVSGSITIEKYSIPIFPEEDEFKKSNFNNKEKDFYIKFPDKVKKIPFIDFIKTKNDDNYFIKVRHYIKSKKKILVIIHLINKGEVTNSFYIFLDLNGSCIEWEEEVLMFIAPPE